MATTIEKVGARLYLVGLPFDAKDAAKQALGMTGDNFDRDRKCWWVGTAKKEAVEAFVKKLNEGGLSAAGENLDKARVFAKVKYQGRTYYVIAETRDLTRCRITTLDGTAPQWVDCQACELERRYEGREVRIGYGRTETVYQTLGGLRDFRDRQREGEKTGVPQCAACGIRSNSLIEDLEDGCMKCRKCCDIPSE